MVTLGNLPCMAARQAGRGQGQDQDRGEGGGRDKEGTCGCEDGDGDGGSDVIVLKQYRDSSSECLVR